MLFGWTGSSSSPSAAGGIASFLPLFIFYSLKKRSLIFSVNRIKFLYFCLIFRETRRNTAFKSSDCFAKNLNFQQRSRYLQAISSYQSCKIYVKKKQLRITSFGALMPYIMGKLCWHSAHRRLELALSLSSSVFTKSFTNQCPHCLPCTKNRHDH
jgi:hypothetical protein